MLTTEWFESNYMKLSQGKSHLLSSGHKHEVMFAKVGHSIICVLKLVSDKALVNYGLKH